MPVPKTGALPLGDALLFAAQSHYYMYLSQYLYCSDRWVALGVSYNARLYRNSALITRVG
jgi:hypothetical protein